MSDIRTYVKVENGIVTNIILADLEFAAAEKLHSAPEGVGIGWSYNGQPDSFSPPQQDTPVVAKVVPSSISRLQAMAALYQAGLLDEIETYIALSTTDFMVKLAWKEAQDFNRNSPLIEGVRVLFNLTVSQMDDLFIFGSTITF